MTGKQLFSIVASMCILACACHDFEKPGKVDIKNIECSNVDGNVLRVNINTEFTQDCDYSICYWRKDKPSESITTKTRQSVGKEGKDTLLFLYPESTYCFKIIIDGAESNEAKTFEFQTYSLPYNMPQFKVSDGEGTKIPGYIFQTQMGIPGYLTITDTDGHVVWYEYSADPANYFDVCADEGVIWLLTGIQPGDDHIFGLAENIECIDLFGNSLHKWSMVNKEIDIPYAHHEIRRMPDGNVAIVSNYTKEFDLTPLGGEKETKIWGDGFAIFNTEGKVLRSWDIFDEIDPLTCSYVDPIKKPGDLVHANSFNWDSEGNYYMTFNNFSQLWKIDSKTGKVLYRVGPDGNVALDESGFAQGLHNATVLAPDRVLCLDNGSERQSSRAIIYKVDPKAMTAEVELSVSLDKHYSSRDRSSVEMILDNSMLMFGMAVSHYVVFTDLKGNILKSLERDGLSYRSYYLEKLPEY